MSFIEKLQKQPENIRKLILWSVVIVIGVILIFFWLRGISNSLNAFEEQDFMGNINISIPKVEMPELSEEELKQLEEEIKQEQNDN